MRGPKKRQILLKEIVICLLQRFAKSRISNFEQALAYEVCVFSEVEAKR